MNFYYRVTENLRKLDFKFIQDCKYLYANEARDLEPLIDTEIGKKTRRL